MASKMASRRRREDSDEEPEKPCPNKFVNDGSFFEAFKKKMEEQSSKNSSSKAEDKKEIKTISRTDNSDSKGPVEKEKSDEDTSSPAYLKSIAEPSNVMNRWTFNYRYTRCWANTNTSTFPSGWPVFTSTGPQRGLFVLALAHRDSHNSPLLSPVH